MADKPLQRDDIARYLLRTGKTLDVFAAELVYLQCYGVPLDKVGLVGRAWQLVSEMLAERQALDLAQNYTLLTVCPHCETEPRITGGKHPTTYCPCCEAVLIATAVDNGRIYHRWSPPERPFVRRTKRSISQNLSQVKRGGQGA